jgi:hypothetical protein
LTSSGFLFGVGADVAADEAVEDIEIRKLEVEIWHDDCPWSLLAGTVRRSARTDEKPLYGGNLNTLDSD